jgi:DNA-directed RNA polymerase specialized sigma24 family protein
MGVESLSDTELLERVRTFDDKVAADELARRCMVKLRKAGRWLGALCPRSEDRQAFVEDVISRAAEKIFKSLHSFQDNFDRWVGVVAKSAALDYIKYLSLRTPEQRETLELAEARPRSAAVGVALAFRSKFFICASDLAQEREIIRVVTLALGLHAQKNEESAVTIRLWCNDYNVAAIARKQGRSPTTIKKLLDHDFRSLKRLLLERFKIRNAGDILKD